MGAGQRARPSSGADLACVALCAGSDCAKDQRKAFRRLAESLADAGVEVTRTRCLGVCHGPVAVVAPDAESPVVVQRLRKGGDRRRLLAVVGGGDPGAELDRDRHVPGRKRREKAERKARAAVA